MDISRASDFGMLGWTHTAENPASGQFVSTWINSQVFAFVDVPLSTPEGDYFIRPWVQLADSSYADPFAGGQVPELRLTVLPDVLDGNGDPFTQSPNPMDGQSTFGTFADIHYEVVHSLPRPALILEYSGSITDPAPAAAELTLSYPGSKLWVMSAHEHNHLGIGSLVKVKGGHAQACFDEFRPPQWGFGDIEGCLKDAGPDAGTVTIRLIDPGRNTRALAVVFSLIDEDDPVDISEFQLGSPQKIWDESGQEMTADTYEISHLR